MITITPIINTKFNQHKAVFSNQQPTVFAEKSDTFESKNLSFKGGANEVNLHLPVKEINGFLKNSNEAIIKISDVIEKERYTRKFIDEFRKLAPTTAPSEISEKQNFFFQDRAHEVYSPIIKFNNYFANQVDFEIYEKLPISISAVEYNNAFEQMCKATLGIIKNWEFLLDNGFDKNNMKLQDVLKLTINSASEKAKNNKVKIRVSGANLLYKYENQMFEHITSYELYNVFSNIIRNAAKYTKKGSTVNVKFKKQKINNKNFLVFSVKDKGIGIPKEEQEKVLRGERALNAISSGIEGTGYGLKRVFKILDFNGQQLKIKSPLNEADREFPGTEVEAFIQLKD